MRIVLGMIEPPLPFGNAAARWYYVLLKGLVERGHNVTAFATCSRSEEIEQARELFPTPQYDLRCYAHPERNGVWAKLETLRRPYSYMFSESLKRDLATELARGFNVLHLEQLWCGWLGLNHKHRTLLDVLNLYEIDWAQSPPTSVMDRLRQTATFRAEKYLLRQYPHLSTLTPRLTARVKEINPSATVHTIPLGMDLTLYEFWNEPEQRWPPTVSLIGSFNWGPTYSAGVRLLTRLWPEIKRRVPEARLQIVGREARKSLAEFVGVQNGEIEIFENVPDTIPYFRETDVLLYPTPLGSGMKVKVLEAFALGVPVVTTNDGVEGLSAIDGVQAGICEDDAGLIERTVTLLRNPAIRVRQRKAALRLLEQTCATESVLKKLDAVYQELIARDVPS